MIGIRNNSFHLAYLVTILKALPLSKVQNMWKIFSLQSPRKLSKFARLQFLNDIKNIYKIFGTWQISKIGVLANFSIPKLKYFKIAQLLLRHFL